MNILDILKPNENILGATGSNNAPADSAQFKMPRGTLLFLQLAYTQGFTAILRGLLGPSYSTGTVYVLYGCGISTVNTAGPTGYYAFNAGAVFYNDEIFLYNGGPAAITTGETVPVFSMVTIPYSGDGADADPVTYTDGTIHNIHNMRQVAISAGSPADPLAYSKAIFVDFDIPPEINLTVSGAATITADSVYPNITVNVPTLLNPIRASGTAQVNANNAGGASAAGDVPGGNGISLDIVFDPPFTDNNYYVLGALRGLSSQPYLDARVCWVLMSSSMLATGFSIWLREYPINASTDQQDLYFDYIVFSQ